MQAVLQRDLRHSPAYKLLSQVYEGLGQPERAQRVLMALSSPCPNQAGRNDGWRLRLGQSPVKQGCLDRGQPCC